MNRQRFEEVGFDTLTCPTGLAGYECVEKHGMWGMAKMDALIKVGEHPDDVGWGAQPEGTNDLEVSERLEVFGRFVAVELDFPKPQPIGDPHHLARMAIDEEADGDARRGQARDDPRPRRHGRRNERSQGESSARSSLRRR